MLLESLRIVAHLVVAPSFPPRGIASSNKRVPCVARPRLLSLARPFVRAKARVASMKQARQENIAASASATVIHSRQFRLQLTAAIWRWASRDRQGALRCPRQRSSKTPSRNGRTPKGSAAASQTQSASAIMKDNQQRRQQQQVLGRHFLRIQLEPARSTARQSRETHSLLFCRLAPLLLDLD